MAESKFSGIFQQGLAEEPQAPARKAPIHTAKRTAPVPVPMKAPGRPPGKRSDPDYKQYSVLLKKQTHRQASNILREQEDGQDVSELLQELLEQWLKKQQRR